MEKFESSACRGCMLQRFKKSDGSSICLPAGPQRRQAILEFSPESVKDCDHTKEKAEYEQPQQFTI